MMGVDQGVSTAADWAASGLAWLTGPSDGAPDFSRAAVLVEARRVTTDIAGLLGVEVDAATVLAGRAAIMNLRRRGRISAGGATRLLATADGWCALALPRADDAAALPALMEVDVVTGDAWTALSHWAATRSTEAVVARAQLLDIAAAALGEAAAEPPAVRVCGASAGPRRPDGLLVADLSSLWAGPLCAQVLALRGRRRRQGGKPEPTRRHPKRRAGLLRLDELRKAFLCRRFR